MYPHGYVSYHKPCQLCRCCWQIPFAVQQWGRLNKKKQSSDAMKTLIILYTITAFDEEMGESERLSVWTQCKYPFFWNIYTLNWFPLTESVSVSWQIGRVTTSRFKQRWHPIRNMDQLIGNSAAFLQQGWPDESNSPDTPLKHGTLAQTQRPVTAVIGSVNEKVVYGQGCTIISEKEDYYVIGDALVDYSVSDAFKTFVQRLDDA